MTYHEHGYDDATGDTLVCPVAGCWWNYEDDSPDNPHNETQGIIDAMESDSYPEDPADIDQDQWDGP